LEWVADWASFYASAHGCDAILLYDNASTGYKASDLERTLKAVSGIEVVKVVEWPYSYGVIGSSNFCQFSMLEHARRRFLARARSVVNADIDEFFITSDRRSIFELTERSVTGYVRVTGRFVSNATNESPGGRRHRDFCYLDPRDPPSPRKWAVVPSLCPDAAVWRVHHIKGMASDDVTAALVEFRHFKAINTNWRHARWQKGLEVEEGRRARWQEGVGIEEGVVWDRELAEWMAGVPWQGQIRKPQ
jgi:hypothetical protein